MTEETASKLTEMVKNYLEIEYSTLALNITLTFTLLAFIAFSIYKLYKMKKYRKEWVMTLTDEQRKVLEDEKKYNL